MNAITKYEYTVDPNHPLLRVEIASKGFLDALPAVMVEVLADEARKISSARLFIAGYEWTTHAIVSRLIPAGPAGDDVEMEAAESELFLRIAYSELARRYRSHELETELHDGNAESAKWASQEIAKEDTAQTATVTESDEHLIGQPSDGIVA